MKSFLFIFTLVLLSTGLSEVEAISNYQSLNFLKFLKLMKANGWDKKVWDSYKRKIAKNLLISENFKQDYGSELESKTKAEKSLRLVNEGKN